MAQAIGRAQSVVVSHPDSTLAILRDIDIEALDSHRAQAHYLTGCAKLRMQNFPDAMWALLHAEKLSAHDEDYSMLTLTRLKMMELADSLYDRESKRHYALSAAEAYDLLTRTADTVVSLSGPDGVEIDMAQVVSKSRSLGLRTGSTPAPQDSTFQGGKFIVLINEGDNWESSLLNDSVPLSMSDLHTLINRLWDKGKTVRLNDCSITTSIVATSTVITAGTST